MDTREEGHAARDFAAWNEEMVSRYDIERYYERSHPIVRWIERRRIRCIIDLAQPRTGDRVLEVGCGAGHVLQHFAAYECTGVDLSRQMLARARSRLGQNVSLVHASADCLPFDEKYDIVICTEVLEHTPDPRAVAAELLRVSAPGARVIITIPNEKNIDRVKRILRNTPVLRGFLRTLAEEGNEWHLHDFDLPLLQEVVDGIANIRNTVGIPFPFLPARYVVTLEPPSSSLP